MAGQEMDLVVTGWKNTRVEERVETAGRNVGGNNEVEK